MDGVRLNYVQSSGTSLVIIVLRCPQLMMISPKTKSIPQK